jgi:transcriptional regulator with XRE-family HTH domain
MLERIQAILKSKNLSASQFAEKIGIQPSGISHILSGRNRPSLEFVQKLLKRFPDINADWLLFGKGDMEKAEEKSLPEKKEVSSSPDLFSVINISEEDINNGSGTSSKEEKQKSENQDTAAEDKQPSRTREEVLSMKKEAETINEPVSQLPGTANNPAKKISKIIVFYPDKTFSEYFPE